MSVWRMVLRKELRCCESSPAKQYFLCVAEASRGPFESLDLLQKEVSEMSIAPKGLHSLPKVGANRSEFKSLLPLAGALKLSNQCIPNFVRHKSS